MERTITITGRGSLRLPPDRIELPITLREEDADYAAALSKAGEALSGLTEALEAAGFKAEELRETEFSVSPAYDSVDDGRGRYRQVFRAYECRRELCLRFELDRARLARAVEALASCPAGPEINVRYTLRDPEAAKSALLAKAAQDARAKAEALCAASGVRLGLLMQVRCGMPEPELYSNSHMRLAAKMSMDGFSGLSPEEIEVEEEVVFVWEIR